MDLSKILKNINLLVREEINCPYNCTFKGTRTELNDHMLNNAKEHIQSIIFDMEQKMIQMEENIINQTRQSIYDLSIEIENLKKFVDPIIPSAPSEIIYPICPYVWEITDFPTKLAIARSKQNQHYISPPFYLFKGGYFASLKIYPNGDGAGRENFLSAFLSIRHGIYDDGLIWPFTGKVDIRIIKGYGKWDKGHGFKFKGNEIQPAFKKPTTIMNIGSGCPTFIHIDKLLCDYLINDNVFIEIRYVD